MPERVTNEGGKPADVYSGLNAPETAMKEYLGGVPAIAKFLGWPVRKVRYARETGALPIRVKTGVGLYAFKSELIAALKTPATLGQNPRAH